MYFKFFLENYYLPDRLSILMKLLIDLGIEDQVEDCINQYFNDIKQNSLENMIVHLAFTISNFTSCCNNALSKLAGADKKVANDILLELGIFLIRETYKKSNLPKDTYFNILRLSLQKTYDTYGWNFSQLSKVLNLNRVANVSASKRETTTQTNLKKRKKIYFIWSSRNELPRDPFIHDIYKEFKITGGKENLFALFDAIKLDFKIVVHSSKLEAFIILFYMLYKHKVILAKGGKGYLKYIQEHIVAPEGDVHPHRPYHKLRSECLCDKDRRLAVEIQLSHILQVYLGVGQLDN